MKPDTLHDRPSNSDPTGKLSRNFQIALIRELARAKARKDHSLKKD